MSSTLRCWTCVRSLRWSQHCPLKRADLRLQAEASNQSQRMSSIQLLYAGVRHGFCHMRLWRLRPTTGGLQSPMGAPVQLGPSPLAQEYCRRCPCRTPPAQWGNHDAREDGEEECELFRGPPQAEGDPTQDVFEPEHGMEHRFDTGPRSIVDLGLGWFATGWPVCLSLSSSCWSPSGLCVPETWNGIPPTPLSLLWPVPPDILGCLWGWSAGGRGAAGIFFPPLGCLPPNLSPARVLLFASC